MCLPIVWAVLHDEARQVEWRCGGAILKRNLFVEDELEVFHDTYRIGIYGGFAMKETKNGAVRVGLPDYRLCGFPAPYPTRPEGPTMKGSSDEEMNVRATQIAKERSIVTPEPTTLP